MRVHIGGDHAAYELQLALVTHLQEGGHEVTNHGPHVFDSEDDYPVAVLRAAKAVADDPGSLGVVLGGSGNGEQMAANKVKGIRAALCWTAELAQLAREHNNAQVVSIGGRFTATEVAKEIVDTFLATEFSGVDAPRAPARDGDRVTRTTGPCLRSPPPPRSGVGRSADAGVTRLGEDAHAPLGGHLDWRDHDVVQQHPATPRVPDVSGCPLAGRRPVRPGPPWSPSRSC